MAVAGRSSASIKGGGDGRIRMEPLDATARKQRVDYAKTGRLSPSSGNAVSLPRAPFASTTEPRALTFRDPSFFQPQLSSDASTTPALPPAYAEQLPETRERSLARVDSGRDASWHYIHTSALMSPQQKMLPPAVDSDVSSVTSGASSPERTRQRSMRQFPPSRLFTDFFHNHSDAQLYPQMPTYFASPPPPPPQLLPPPMLDPRVTAYPDSGGGHAAAGQPKASDVSALWSRYYDQRRKVAQCRRNMAELRSKIKIVRSEKLHADNALHKLTRSLSRTRRSRKTVSQTALTKLLDEIQSLNSTYTSMESQYEVLEKELDDREAKLEVSEVDFFQEFFSSQRPQLAAQPPTHGPAAPGEAEVLFQDQAQEQEHDQDQDQDQDQDPDKPLQHEVVPSPPDWPHPDAASPEVVDRTTSSLLGIAGDRPVDMHPLYRSLLDMIGDVSLAEEGYEELVFEKEALISDLEARIFLEKGRGGSVMLTPDDVLAVKLALSGDHRAKFFEAISSAHLDEGDRRFLETFHDLAEAAEADIQRKAEQVKRIRAKCINIGAVPKSGFFQHRTAEFGDNYNYGGGDGDIDGDDNEGGGGGGGNDMDGEDEDAYAISVESAVMAEAPPPGFFDGRLLKHPAFPLLLSSPQHVLADPPLTARSALKKALDLPADYPGREELVEECVKEYGILTMLMRTAPESKSEFVNRWMLQRLRISSLEVVLLHSIFSEKLKVVNLTRWQEDVLYFWPRDDSSLPEHYFYRSITRGSSPTVESRSNTHDDDDHSGVSSGQQDVDREPPNDVIVAGNESSANPLGWHLEDLHKTSEGATKDQMEQPVVYGSKP
ncbi:hypothetical protein SPI_07354 [Niveomyces insectorum RCEF 264]|uniref:Uncharacterized protein n=1 Tax=Niveomyces insectorum RCEF 264 TaxID=1081102 RepID=A0A167PSC8_9HYPO|nr:hypothetical protein SPI_07354 [Niveomyces insectorum RCEF 264]